MDYKFSILSLLVLCLVISQVASSQLLQMESMESLVAAEKKAKKMMSNTTITVRQIIKDVDIIQKKIHHIIRKLKREGHMEVVKDITATKRYVEHIDSYENLKLTAEIDKTAALIKAEIEKEIKAIDVAILAEARKVNSTTQLANKAIKVVDKAGKALINKTGMAIQELGNQIKMTVGKAAKKIIAFANKTRESIHKAVVDEGRKVEVEIGAKLGQDEVKIMSEIKNDTANIEKEIIKTAHSLKGPVVAELKNMTPEMMKFVTDLKIAVSEADVIAKRATQGAAKITSLANSLNRTTEVVQKIQARMLYEAHRLEQFSKQVEATAIRAEEQAQLISKAIEAISAKDKSSKKQ